MDEIAKVIVDVSSSQTDQAYDYLIPDNLKNQLSIGYRVKVPFGTRFVQGFVVDITYTTGVDYALKYISDILDAEPVLTPELVALGDYLSQTVFSFKMSCYKTMLPNFLKANYHKEVEWIDNTSCPPLFEKQKRISWKMIESLGMTHAVLKWKKEEKVIVHYLVEDKITHKTQRFVSLVKPIESIPIRANAHQQKALLDYLSQSSKVSTKTLAEANISLKTLQSAKQKGWIEITEEVIERNPYEHITFEKTMPLTLNEEQKTVYTQVKESILKREPKTFLLEGVTGSGKTEVYLQLISDVIQNGRTALLLVPEIALTPQMVKHFKGRFGQRVAVLHSGLSEGERYDEWLKAKEKKADIVVGARSSIFAPLDNIGLIIIDEEHETTYKQMDTVKYHARDVAIWRGQYHQCPVVLGSATPSLESRARAQKGNYTFLTLTKRANDKPLPHVQIVDMTTEKKVGNFDLFSDVLKLAIEDRLQKKEQVALLLNRRGYASFLMCRDCGHVMQCPNCDISLTLHKDTHKMKCHYCGFDTSIPTECPNCFSDKVRSYGVGTQRVEEALYQLFPQAKVVRMDVDTTSKKGQHERLLNIFGSGEADILLGTQMIAKGLDFPNITLVGVINADTSLYLPDFRASEKTYQLLTQVAGRAGRGTLSGEVIIQTYNPEHYVLQLAQTQQYEEFYKREMYSRYMGHYPPYVYTTTITITHHFESTALKSAYQIKQILEQSLGKDVVLLGPSAKSIARINNKFYFQILLKYKNIKAVEKVLYQITNDSQELAKEKIYVSIDVNPVNFI
ncbi:primosomal protein N' [Granulicatella sp. zg-ZJ]|uniref:primosomal protein N' n=1 Tax=Granulicatella sp. zg-ZJ TaxID=2678504 RepID=UPI0013D38ABD|nr:primosomal protein N' [Granulicatella sp. zg-ZJ]MBS4749636.1 primosomal protein N' [Carnobacteriaceae bacterium zg-ZUI78]NEW61765.1 primosomal protein N' [Granulicatella sp. zg-ZJ]